MTNFKTRKIRDKTSSSGLSETAKRNIFAAIGFLLTLLLLYVAAMNVIRSISGAKFLNFFAGFAGKDLAVDTRNHTNLLLLGVGGEGHDGKDLTDTMIIASIDHAEKSIAMISIPRDLWTETVLGGNRVNRLYELGKASWGSAKALEFTKTTLAEMFDLPIHYVIKVDFKAAEEIVDALGGIDVYVAEDIIDPYYPRDGTYEYEPFYLASGLQHLNGKTALKYVRSRKTSSDFDRSSRQQQVLIALKEKAVAEDKLTEARFLKNLFYSLSEHVETTLSMREIVGLAQLSGRLDSKRVQSASLHDDPSQTGGFLFTPARDLFGGAFVLLPAESTLLGDKGKKGYGQVNLYIEHVLYGGAARGELSIAILNGTKIPGLAATARSAFNRFGLNVSLAANGRDQKKTQTAWYLADKRAVDLLKFMQQLIPGSSTDQIPPEYQQDPRLVGSALILELGQDGKQDVYSLDIFKNIVLLSPSIAASSTPTAGTSTPQN